MFKALTIAVCIIWGTLCPANASNPITNYKSGISIGFNGTDEADYVFERWYHDPLVDDHGTFYIKSSLPITLQHNERNAVIGGGDGGGYNSSGVLPDSQINNGEIIYRLDRELQYGVYSWSANSGTPFPSYTAPLVLDNLTYDNSDPVTGTTGPVPGVEITDKTNYYMRGITDAFGDEYHVLAVADDDEWRGLTGSGREHSSSDGKTFLLCVNPKTPALFVEPVGGSEYYTTPAKVYLIPKIHEQTTYFTGDLNISLVNIMSGASVYYRFGTDAFTQYTGPVSTASLGDGTHVLEYYYDDGFHKTRTFVKNPDYPSKNERISGGFGTPGHGYLTWQNREEFERRRDRALADGSLASVRANDWFMNHESYDTYMRKGLRVSGGGTFTNAVVAAFKGVENDTVCARYAKMCLLENSMSIDRLGHEYGIGQIPLPSKECWTYGYYAVNAVFSNAFAYDMMISIYRADQHPGGITVIEDYKIRDIMAGFMCDMMRAVGGFNSGTAAADASPSTGMWTTALFTGATVAAMAMPGYDSPYFGTSGFDGRAASHEWTPFRDHPASWKDVFFTYWNQDDAAHTAVLHGYPNQRHLFNWYNGGLIFANGDWYDRAGYTGYSLMGHCIQLWANVLVKKLHHLPPTVQEFFRKGNAGTLYCKKSDDPRYPESEYALNRNMLIGNEYFREYGIASPITYMEGDRDVRFKMTPYNFCFGNEAHWETDPVTWDTIAPPCTSLAVPTVPGSFAGQALSAQQVRLTWTASTHADCGVEYYEIRRDGSTAGTTEELSYTDDGRSEDEEYSYEVSAVSYGGVRSAWVGPVSVTTHADTLPPELLRAYDSNKPAQVLLSFNEAVDTVTAENASNYGVDNGITVNAARLVSANDVSLTLSALSSGITYTLTVNGIKDASKAGNVMTAAGTDTFRYTPPVQGGMAGYWDLDADGTTVPDLSGNGHDGTVSNAVFSSDGKYGGCRVFDTTDASTVNLGAWSVAPGGTGNDGLTVALWVKATGWQSTTYRNPQLCYKKNSWKFNPRSVGSNTAPEITVYTSNGTSTFKAGGPNIELDAWIHVAFTYSGDSLIAYTNGVRAGGIAATGALVANTEPVQLATGGFIGSLDELYIFDRALDAAEITAVMNAAGSGIGAPAVYSAVIDGIPFTIAPNPASAFVQVLPLAGAALSGVTVTDRTGVVVLRAAAAGRIPVYLLETGIYYLTATVNGRAYTRRLMVVK